jgi:tetratricopeptide (TPR) repeat protein
VKVWVFLAPLLAARVLAAQQTPYDKAFDLERRGSYAQAAEGYRKILTAKPAELNALLGLERVLHELGKPAELAPAATAAIAADSRNPVLYGIAVRAWTAAGNADTVRRIVDRWAAVEPGSEAPYREWGFAALAARDRENARAAYRIGREKLRKPDALAGELAQLSTYEGDYPQAITEWLTAVRGMPGYRASALGMLSQVPVDRRSVVLAEFDKRGDPLADRLAGGLAARWNEPAAGYERILKRLPAGADGVPVLEEFLEEVRALPGRDAALARARALETMADRNAAQRTRYLAEAARAYADAGEQNSARRMLSRLASDPKTSPDAAATAGVTLIGVLIAEGKLDEADTRLAEVKKTLSVEEAERITHQVARGWLHQGKLDRAEALVKSDSSIEGMAIRGRARLYHGDIGGALKDLAAAGPFAADRGDATERAAVLAILQVLDADTLPALGSAYLALERGDTASAATGFADLAARLPPERGGGELTLLAGRLRQAQGSMPQAEQLFRKAGAAKGTAAAPAARLELARVLVRQGKQGEAITALEELILEYPESAVAPQARRLLDSVRGGIPRG